MGCRKMHCIVNHKDGTFEMSLEIRDCDECFLGNLSSCLYGKKNVLDVDVELENDEDQEEELDDEDNPDEQIDLSDAIAP